MVSERTTNSTSGSDAWAPFVEPLKPDHLPSIGDKWILSSALQKLIRRGERSWAIAVAKKLHSVDPGYLRRRLPVIAVEDIGIGDLLVCDSVMGACIGAAWKPGQADALIERLVGTMASAIKNRAACDLYCWSEVHPFTSSMMPRLLASSGQELMDQAVDPTQDRLARANCLRLLGGLTDGRYESYRVVRKPELWRLDRAAELLNVPENMRRLVRNNGRTSKLASMLPLAVELITQSVEIPQPALPRSMDGVLGVPLCSVDQFSTIGRAALKEFFGGAAAFKTFAERHVVRRTPWQLFNMALFHAESGSLGVRLSSPEMDDLTAETEFFEMRHLGMRDASTRHDLLELIRSQVDDLAVVRERHLLAVESQP